MRVRRHRWVPTWCLRLIARAVSWAGVHTRTRNSGKNLPTKLWARNRFKSTCQRQRWPTWGVHEMFKGAEPPGGWLQSCLGPWRGGKGSSLLWFIIRFFCWFWLQSDGKALSDSWALLWLGRQLWVGGANNFPLMSIYHASIYVYGMFALLVSKCNLKFWMKCFLF